MSSLPRFLYHGTRLSNLDSVLQHGIRPRGDRPSNWPKQPSHPDCVYLTANQAFTYGQCWGTETKVVVFEIFLNRLRKKDLLPDEDAVADSIAHFSGGKQTYHEILPQVVNNLLGYQRYWRQSILATGSVAHWGIVPLKAITRYCIVDFENRRALTSGRPASSVFEYHGTKSECDQNTKWFFGDVNDCYMANVIRTEAQQADDPKECLRRGDAWFRVSQDRTGIQVVDLNPVKRKAVRRHQV